MTKPATSAPYRARAAYEQRKHEAGWLTVKVRLPPALAVKIRAEMDSSGVSAAEAVRRLLGTACNFAGS